MSKLNLELLSENEISDFLAGVDSLGTDKDTYSRTPSQIPHMSHINDTLVSQKSKRFCKKSIRLKRFKMMR